MTDLGPAGTGDERTGVTDITLHDIERCFGGAVPAVLTTSSADGVPNVMYVSRAHQVDESRVAVSNQFLSKTARNLIANPHADLILLDPTTHDEYRLSLVYERTDRRGHVFDRLRADIEALAALTGMQDVFRLRAADIFRVVEIESMQRNPGAVVPLVAPTRRAPVEVVALAEWSRRLARASDLDSLFDVALEGLDTLLGYQHTMMLLLDEQGRSLFTIASRGFGAAHVGAEVPIGEGQIGLAAERCEPLRVGGISQLHKYSRSIKDRYVASGGEPGREIPVPGLPDAQSRVCVPAIALGELVGVLVAESPHHSEFGVADEQLLIVAASMLASAVGSIRESDRGSDETIVDMMTSEDTEGLTRTDPRPLQVGTITVRYFAADASTFFDNDYVIKGVAGRILWSLLSQHQASGRIEFSNRELRLDPALELPGFKDNLESRLLLLQRRLDEREAPVRIEKTSRGRFRIRVDAPLALTLGDC